jgi:hypothetical protein
MTDAIRQVAADLLEAPEEASKLMGQALEAVGAELEKLSDRIAALEAQVRGQ